jgi:hypothetical protein
MTPSAPAEGVIVSNAGRCRGVSEAAQRYLRDLARAHATQQAAPEISYYPALERLLNGVGNRLTPAVTAVINIRDQGAGIPDGGLFAAHQLRRSGGPQAAFARQLPTHGVVEAKPADMELDLVLQLRQIARYLERYGKVLVTNFRQFQLLVQDDAGQAVRREPFSLADTEARFWALASEPDPGVGQELEDYLRRALLHGAPISRPEDLAWFLASYAQTALGRMEAGDLAALAPLRGALAEALGMTFEGKRQEHFFRSTLVQTLFYGIFSAWVLWSSGQAPGTSAAFDWHTASWWLNVPMVSTLFDQVATASTLRPLQLDEVLDWAGETLNRVNRDVFFRRFQTEAAVQYFYEPFLAAFDPTLRKELGVWYTPPEVVKYMVARVDRVLREDFGLADGLANERVYLLDPCTGTGSFLVEALRTIHATRAAEVGDAFVAEDVKRAALERVIGFEILPAPFVVAHLQLGLLLQQLGAPLGPRSGERVAVYLTNALTGWAEESHAPISFPGLETERDAADTVKRQAPILVVLGNPPYNAFAGVSPAEEGGLVELYKQGLEAWAGGTKQSLDDLYVRFLRIAERRITDLGRGVVCLISNFSYLADPSHVIVRQRLLAEFDRITIDCLNGDSRETGKKTPEGLPDPSIFAAPGQSGITVGTAIGTLVRREARSAAPELGFRNFWGVDKRADLVASLVTAEPPYRAVEPAEDNAYAFRPRVVHTDYYRWPKVAELAEQAPLLGLLENRRGALLAFDREDLTARLAPYFDTTIQLEDLPDELHGVREPAARFDPDRTRRRLLTQGGFRPEAVQRFIFKPLDPRWAYVETTRPLWNDPRPELVRHAVEDARFLLVRRRVPRALDGAAFYLTNCLGDQHTLHKDAYFIPLRLLPTAASDTGQGMLELGDEQPARANLSARARTWLAELGLADPDSEVADSELAWLHALAIGYSPHYLKENRDGGRFTYQRVPLPSSLDELRASAALGPASHLCLTLTTTSLASPGSLPPRRMLGCGAPLARSRRPTAADWSLPTWPSAAGPSSMPRAPSSPARAWSLHDPSPTRNSLVSRR